MERQTLEGRAGKALFERLIEQLGDSCAARVAGLLGCDPTSSRSPAPPPTA